MSECVCGFNPPNDCNPDCERCQLVAKADKWERGFYHILKVGTKARERAAMWEGKFHQLRRENNRLRKKLYQQDVGEKIIEGLKESVRCHHDWVDIHSNHMKCKKCGQQVKIIPLETDDE